MSFFQSLFRRFSKKQEVTTPDIQQNQPEPLGGDTNPTDDANLDNTNPQADGESEAIIKLEDDLEPEVIVKLEDDSASDGVTNLRQNTDLQDDTDLNNNLNPDSDANPQVAATKDDSIPEGYDFANASSRDDKRISRKSGAERRYFDSLFFDSESSSEDETGTGKKDIPFHVDTSSPLPSATNATPQHPLTVQPLTPAARSISFSPHVMNELFPLARSEASTIVRNENFSTAINQPMTTLTSEKVFDQAQIADQPRLPWTWSAAGTKTKKPYEPTAVGKWWWAWAQENKDDIRIISNIARIMETELGEQRFGKEKCMRCQALRVLVVGRSPESKPGPKGPWAEKRRLARLQQNALQHPAALQESQFVPIIAEQLHGDGGSSSSSSTVESPPTNNQFTPSLPIPLIQQYLDAYHERLYPVWPVVDRDEMILRIQDPEDAEAYALCTALTAVVLAHLKFNPADIGQVSHTVDNGWVAGESERARASLRYHEKPSLELLLSSFFLHIFYANRGHVCRATVLIREAITLAQFLELDQAKHYKQLSKKEAQLHLRIIWILSITERGHTTRFDLPRILRLDPDLPPLETKDVQPGLVAFTDLCQLFQTFGRAMDSHMLIRTSDFFVGTDTKLQERRLLQSKTQVQQADFLITQQWMRLMVWKMSIFHIKLSVNADDENLSICFPERVAQIVLMYLNNLSRNIIEAHGIGMQMKVADVAISLADMLSCIPWVSERRQVMKVGPGDMVCHIAQFLASLRGNVNPRMEILFEKLSSRGWGSSPRLMSTSDNTFKSLPTTTSTPTTTTTTTILPIRQIEDISDETGEENNDDYDDYVKRTTLHTPAGY